MCGRVMCGRRVIGRALVSCALVAAERGQPRVLARGFSVVLSVRFPLQIFAVLTFTHAPTHAASCLSCLHLAVGLPETLALSPLSTCRRAGFS